jgi:beta-lactamase class A
MMRLVLLGAIAALLTLPGARAQSYAEGVVGAAMQHEDAGLDEQLGEIAKAHHGKVALYATQLNSGHVAALDADRVVQTASVIKLTILFEAMEQVRTGKAHWDDKITLMPGDGHSADVDVEGCADADDRDER